MAITYPRHFPTVHKIRDCEFELVPVVTADPSRGGNAGAVEHGRQVWRASYKTAMLNSAQAGVWSAWIDSLAGGVLTFRAWNPYQRYAQAYPNGYAALAPFGGSAPWDGNGTCTLATGSSQIIRFEELPANFAATTGDLVSVPTFAGGRELLRILEDATATGGGVLTLTAQVVPPVVDTINDTAPGVAVWEKPWFEAVLDGKSVRRPNSTNGSTLSFECWQRRR